jgi:hypothetical protein
VTGITFGYNATQHRTKFVLSMGDVTPVKKRSQYIAVKQCRRLEAG